MLKGLAKAMAYWKAPVKTFTVLHPVKAVKWGAILIVAKFVLDRMSRRTEGRARAG